MLGQHHAALTQHLGAVHHRVHQQVLVRAEVAHMHPAEQPVLREHIGIAHRMAGAVLHVLVHIVADHQVRGGVVLHQNRQLIQHLFQGLGVQPVVTVHHLVVQARGVADALVHALAVAAVLLMDGLDDGGVFGGVFVADGRGLVLDRAVIHQNDLCPLAGRQQRLDAVAHISRRVVAGHGKGNELLIHILNCSFKFDLQFRRTGGRRMEICVLIIAFSILKSYARPQISQIFRTVRCNVVFFCARRHGFVVYW